MALTIDDLNFMRCLRANSDGERGDTVIGTGAMPHNSTERRAQELWREGLIDGRGRHMPGGYTGVQDTTTSKGRRTFLDLESLT
jgi:hypothetical protein